MHMCTSFGQRSWLFFLDVTKLWISQSKPLKVCFIYSVFTCVCFDKKACNLKGFIFTSGYLLSTQNLSGHFSETVMRRCLTSLLCNVSVFLCNPAADFFLGMKSVFNQSQKQPSVLPVYARLKMWKQCKCCSVTKNKKCTLNTHRCQPTLKAGLFQVFE